VWEAIDALTLLIAAAIGVLQVAFLVPHEFVDQLVELWVFFLRRQLSFNDKGSQQGSGIIELLDVRCPYNSF
jgi:hypothetical protein